MRPTVNTPSIPKTGSLHRFAPRNLFIPP